MSERIEKIVERLKGSRAYWDSVVEQIGDRWETQVYSDGLAWNVRQVVNHVADADKGHNMQVMAIAEGKDPIPPDFDLERYNKRVTEKTTEKSSEQSLEELKIQRQALYDWLYAIDEVTLDKKGRHATLNIFTIEQFLKILSNHERDHAKDIATALNISV
ncbi:MAG: DinB family protein [bacterium]|nr:DinB family protein [bacterium]